MCPECGKLPEHLVPICDGTKVVDGIPIDPEYVTRFRSMLSLPPIGQCNGEEAVYPIVHDSVSNASTAMQRRDQQTAIVNRDLGGGHVGSSKLRNPIDNDPKLGRYAGTNLAILLKACGIYVNDGCSCEEWIEKMNNWSIAENYEHRQEIIDHLKDRAKQEKMSIKKKFWTGVLIMWNGMLPMVSELVDEAIWQAKSAQR